MANFTDLKFHHLILVCCLGLLVLFVIPVFVTDSSIGLWLMQSLPLLVTLPGLLHNKPRSLQWLGFLVLFYLLQGILQIFTPLLFIHIIGIITTLFCVVLFTAVIVRLKTQKRLVAKE